MKPRIDTAFESWGGFSKPMQGAPIIRGKLKYNPETGIELELVENPQGPAAIMASEMGPNTLFGQLLNGTLVTLSDCLVSNVSIGAGVGSPTTLHVGRALIGAHAPDLDELQLKAYAVELSSMSNWTMRAPVELKLTPEGSESKGFDVTARLPDTIQVPLEDRTFDVEVTHGFRTEHKLDSLMIRWSAAVEIRAHNALPLRALMEIAWQSKNLFSLLIGDRLSVRSIDLDPGKPSSDGVEERSALLYHQIDKHDHKDIHPAMMLLPYGMIAEDFKGIVEKWFRRTEQATLATNIFFASDILISGSTNARFLAVSQAAESYHRSLESGLYMNQVDYDAAIQILTSHIPPIIQGDHRQSLKNRLRYGNEYSLRKRLSEMLKRIPSNAATRIAGDIPQFISKVVDTRNYFTHYDHTARSNALDGKNIVIAAERLRFLIVANLLHDLGIPAAKLLPILERSRQFLHWTSEPLLPQRSAGENQQDEAIDLNDALNQSDMEEA
jgi:hypothetical protein